MSRPGSILLFLSGLSLFIGGALRAIFGDWQDFLLIPLGLFLAFFVGAIVKDFAYFKDLLTMRTTKHGMNMGVLILLTIVLLGVFNYAAIRKDKSFDLTENQLNSLSEQSRDILKKLDSEMMVTIFYSGKEGKDQKGLIGDFVRRYQDESSFVKVRYIDARKRPDLANEYKVEKEGLAPFIEYKEKKIRVDLDKIDEEGITNAMVKATRSGQKSIFFIAGHGERDDGSEKAEQLGFFRKALGDASYEVKTWNLLQDGPIPENADLVTIIGPQSYLADPEIKALQGYVEKGGHLFVAADPEMNHNMGELSKLFGIEMAHNFIYDDSGILLGQSIGMVPVFNYSATEEITKKIPRGPNGLTIFDRASSLKKLEGTPFKVEKLAWTHEKTYAAKDLTPDQQGGDPGPHTIMMISTGKAKSSGSGDAPPTEPKNFSAVFVGDSDFMTNVGMRYGMNRDLALNVVASLLKESELVTIRPKEPTGSIVNMTQTQFMILLFSFIIPLPIVMFSLGGWIWWRRRAA